jgi:hypothetical protein
MYRSIELHGISNVLHTFGSNGIRLDVQDTQCIRFLESS